LILSLHKIPDFIVQHRKHSILADKIGQLFIWFNRFSSRNHGDCVQMGDKYSYESLILLLILQYLLPFIRCRKK